MREPKFCTTCLTELEPWQELVGLCNWCLPYDSPESKDIANLDFEYEFDDDDLEDFDF